MHIRIQCGLKRLRLTCVGMRNFFAFGTGDLFNASCVWFVTFVEL
jgi:hypothetical protein